ncbi:oxidoreductase [Aspergillus avenaceus]|uniref:Oxidoreductase n=1 Tax=Aspergillus avenaceus TaxID=36643 RepID=A0A5N6TNL7_ASPAV|nr:oxidoreductase [Aspergillus avenaceus]
MPIPLLAQGFQEGFASIPYFYTVLKVVPWVLLVSALKYYFGGARNGSERLMHSKVVMVTGGTSGIGASVVRELATRGAQVILLTQQAPSDIFLVDYIEDLRRTTKNHLIYAEQVDLSSLYSIRTFATKWIDNVPPRRLDMVILCGNTAVPSSQRRTTVDGLDEEWQVNYLSNFHLLSILSPALRVQPAHRDVRVIFTTCSSYIGAKIDLKQVEAACAPGAFESSKAVKKPKTPTSLFGASKLALMIFANSFQKHLNSVERADKMPPCTRVITVDPGYTRTPGTRRWLTGGSLWGLLLYLITWPLWWLILKSPEQGAQSILYAAMEARYGRGTGGWMVKECQEVDLARREIKDEEIGKKLWQFSEKQIELREKEGAVRRALEKQEQESKKNGSSTSGAKEPTPGSRRSRKTK